MPRQHDYFAVYAVEYARSGRSKCQGCKGTIPHGGLRVGTHVELPVRGGGGESFTSTKWRHWGCMTGTVVRNMSQKLGGDPAQIAGFGAISEEDQALVRGAFKSPPPNKPRAGGMQKGQGGADKEEGEGVTVVQTPKKRDAKGRRAEKARKVEGEGARQVHMRKKEGTPESPCREPSRRPGRGGEEQRERAGGIAGVKGGAGKKKAGKKRKVEANGRG